MKIDKVTYLVVAALLLLPAIVIYVWIVFQFMLSNANPVWLSIALVGAVGAGTYVGIYINPAIAYKRNNEICVGGIPFPVHYGMPINDACISGYVSFRNFILDIVYICMVFVGIVLLVYSNGIKYGLITSLLTISGVIIVTRIFLHDVLHMFPIEIVDKEKRDTGSC